MTVTIDSAGRLVIPKEAREQAGLRPGMPLEVRVRDGRIEIEPAPLDVTIEKRGRFHVAVPKTKGPALTNDMVERTRRAVRRERGVE
jgi:AbrB family looped-hinge helix DNA binding protein